MNTDHIDDSDVHINGALEFRWYDGTGRLLMLRCGRLDADHLEGWFAIYVNNILVYKTDKEPNSALDDVQLSKVMEWGEGVLRTLKLLWEAAYREKVLKERKRKGLPDKSVLPLNPHPLPSMSYNEWKAELITVTARATGQSESQIKISDPDAQIWYDDGFTPYQCFRETYDMENDSSV